MSVRPIRSVLVASDLRTTADAILAAAFELARRVGAEVHVVHAIEFFTVPYSAISAADDYQRPLHEAGESLEEQVRRSAPTGMRASSVQVREGSAPKAILERSLEVDADLIVIGPALPHGFHLPIPGNTADRLVAIVSVPVLVLRDAAPLELRRVVVPIDLADPARGALDQGIHWAESLAPADRGGESSPAEVRVLYVIPRRYRDSDPAFSDVVVGPQLHLEIEDAQHRVGTANEVRVRAHTVWGDAPAEEILANVESTPTDLLVLGAHGYGAVRRALIGSVTSKVVRAASCPTLLVPPSLWVPESRTSRGDHPVAPPSSPLRTPPRREEGTPDERARDVGKHRPEPSLHPDGRHLVGAGGAEVHDADGDALRLRAVYEPAPRVYRE